MYGKQTRQLVRANLIPNRGVVFFQREDPLGDPVQNFNPLAFRVQASEDCTQDIEFRAQDSEDGVVWEDRDWEAYPDNAALKPGGFIDFTVTTVHKYARILAYSAGAGMIEASVLIPEEQVTPRLISSDGAAALACATYCEIDCETGEED